MHQAIPGTLKPRIRKMWGIWHCANVAGKTPKDAYENWKRDASTSALKRLQEAYERQNRQRDRDHWLERNQPWDLTPRYITPPVVAPMMEPTPKPLGPPWVITCTSSSTVPH